MKKIIGLFSLLLMSLGLFSCSNDYNLSKTDSLKNIYFSARTYYNSQSLEKIDFPDGTVYHSYILDSKYNNIGYIVFTDNEKYGLLSREGDINLECIYPSPDFYIYNGYVATRYTTDFVDEYRIIKIDGNQVKVSMKVGDMKCNQSGMVSINGTTYDLNDGVSEIIGGIDQSGIGFNNYSIHYTMGKYNVLISNNTIIVVKKNKFVNKFKLDGNYNVFPLRKNNLLIQKIDATSSEDYTFMKDDVRYKLTTYLVKIKNGDKKHIDLQMYVNDVKQFNDLYKGQYGKKVNKGNLCVGYPINDKKLSSENYVLFNNNMKTIHNYSTNVSVKLNDYLYKDNEGIKNKKNKLVFSCTETYKLESYVIGSNGNEIKVYDSKGKQIDSISGKLCTASGNGICYKYGDEVYLYNIVDKTKKIIEGYVKSIDGLIIVKYLDYSKILNISGENLLGFYSDYVESLHIGDSNYVIIGENYYKKG